MTIAALGHQSVSSYRHALYSTDIPEDLVSVATVKAFWERRSRRTIGMTGPQLVTKSVSQYQFWLPEFPALTTPDCVAARWTGFTIKCHVGFLLYMAMCIIGGILQNVQKSLWNYWRWRILLTFLLQVPWSSRANTGHNFCLQIEMVPSFVTRLHLQFHQCRSQAHHESCVLRHNS